MAIYDLYEDECSKVKRSTTSDPMVHILTGKGVGSQYYSIEDEAATGVVLWEVIEVDQGFKDPDGLLVDYTIDEFLTRLQDYQWDVTTRRKLILLPGDFIKFHPKYEVPEELSVISYEKNSDGELQIELGSRQPDFSDAWEGSQDRSNGYSAKYLLESHASISSTASDFYINDVTHATAPTGSMVFDVPSSVKDTDLLARITLELSIELKTNKLLTVGCCALELKTASAYRQYGNIIGWSPGVDISEIDITDWISAPAEFDPLYDDLSAGTLTLTGTWPTGGSKLIIEASEASGHIDCTGSITINSPSGETITLSGAGEYASIDTLVGLPTITTSQLDCHLKITVTIPNTITLGVYMAEDYSETHSAYTEHPVLTAHGTMKFWKRRAIA